MDDDDVAADASASPSPSPTSSPLPVASALPVADPVTVAAAPPNHLLTLALPIQKPAALAGQGASAAGSGGGGREDAWSEGATSALIDAWGERFLALGRGSLRHPQWQEVADAVSSRDGYSKAPKSDVQCKNRIDTLKKKYKIEKAKSASSWPFFDRLDALLAPTYKPGNNNTAAAPNPNGRNPPLRVSFPQRSRTPLLPAAPAAGPAARRRPPSPEASATSESSDGFPPEPALPAANGKRRRTEEGRADGAGDRAQGLRELAHAIRRLGEAYERVETAKLEQAAAMEQQRLEFARELESQRVQFFLNTQMELSQVKNRAPPAATPAVATTAGSISRRMAMVADAGTSGNHHGRYRVSEGGHRLALPSHYQYHENNVTAAADSDGEQTDDDDDDDDEDEEESQ